MHKLRSYRNTFSFTIFNKISVNFILMLLYIVLLLHSPNSSTCIDGRPQEKNSTINYNLLQWLPSILLDLQCKIDWCHSSTTALCPTLTHGEVRSHVNYMCSGTNIIWHHLIFRNIESQYYRWFLTCFKSTIVGYLMISYNWA